MPDNPIGKENLSEFNTYLLKALNTNEGKAKSMAPYITINKLAEYTEAKAVRRRQILKSLKEDKDYTKVWYQPVRSSLTSYFRSNYDISILNNAIQECQKKSPTTTWDTSDKDNSILALESLKDTELPDLSDYDVVMPDEKLESILLSGVKVTIKPEIYLINKHSRKVGAIKFHLAKTEANRLSQPAMQNAATMIKYGLIESGYNIKDIDTNACLSIDIFAKNYAASPAAYIRTLETLKVCCEEIFVRWDSI